MSIFKLAALISTAALAAAAPALKHFRGHKVMRFDVQNEEQLKALGSVVEENNLDVWTDLYVGDMVDIHFTPEQLKFVDSLDIKHSVMIEDLEDALEEERAPLAEADAKHFAEISADEFFGDYRSYSAVVAFLDKLANNHSSVSRFEIGKSLQGRSMAAVKISSGGNKPVIYLQGALHAREWITIPTVSFLADFLAKGTDPRATAMLDKYDFVLMPLSNPDGYEFSRASDRMWRKNRSTNGGARCQGTDLNRNYPFEFTGSGSSTSKCSDTYRGSGPASEPETKNIIKYVKANEIASFMDVHCYSQIVLTGPGYTRNREPNADLLKAAKRVASAMGTRYGTRFTAGPIARTLYPVAGGSTDWAEYDQKIKYSLGFELRPANRGGNGFVLPRGQIVPSGEEFVDGIYALFQEMTGNDSNPGNPTTTQAPTSTQNPDCSTEWWCSIVGNCCA